MSLGNRFTKHDGSWRIVGPCIDDGECIGDYVEVNTSNGTKNVIISKIEEVQTVHPFSRKIKTVKMGVPMSKEEEAEYVGIDTEENLFWDY